MSTDNERRATSEYHRPTLRTLPAAGALLADLLEGGLHPSDAHDLANLDALTVAAISSWLTRPSNGRVSFLTYEEVFAQLIPACADV